MLLNPIESSIFNMQPQCDNHQLSVTTQGGLVLLCTNKGVKLLRIPLGTEQFESQMLKKLMQSIEDDLTVLQEFLHLHQLLKLATFCITVNTCPTYLMQSAEPSISRPFLKP